MFRGIWFPRCGSDLMNGRVTILEANSGVSVYSFTEAVIDSAANPASEP
jgi:hypothetical protein